jgi:hypothetical protein
MWLILLLLSSSCSLLLPNSKANLSAKNNAYTIVFNKQDWQEKIDESGSDYVWENTADGGLLIANSFCKQFQDEPLDELGNKSFRDISHLVIDKKEFTTFHDREAYRIEGHGKLDGVDVALSILNTRRNNCYFDFLFIKPYKMDPKQNLIFEEFLNSVVFK